MEPYELFRIDNHEGSTATPVSDEANVEELAHEMIEDADLPFDQKGKVRVVASLHRSSIYVHPYLYNDYACVVI